MIPRKYCLNLSLLVTFLILANISCKKEGEAPFKIATNSTIKNPSKHDTLVLNNNSFYPLSIGSYWIYEFENYLPDGTSLNQATKDTFRVIGDTLIYEEQYFIFKTDFPTDNSIYYRRINDRGEVVSQHNLLICPPNGSYSSIFNQHYGFSGVDTTFYYWEEFSGPIEVETKHGESYSCIQMTAYHQAWPSFGGKLIADTNYFSIIGRLQRSYSYLSGIKRIGKLVEYHNQ